MITYCGGGIAASQAAYLLTLLGKENVALYNGSMMEWGADPNLPLVTGSAPKHTEGRVARPALTGDARHWRRHGLEAAKLSIDRHAQIAMTMPQLGVTTRLVATYRVMGRRAWWYTRTINSSSGCRW